jgi:hypothetical protein
LQGGNTSLICLRIKPQSQISYLIFGIFWDILNSTSSSSKISISSCNKHNLGAGEFYSLAQSSDTLGGESVENLPRQKLIEIIQESKYLKKTRGFDVIDEPHYCKQELIGRCSGNCMQEIDLLIQAQRIGIAKSLRSRSSDSPLKQLMEQLSQQLIKNNNFTPRAAKWVTETWAMAVISPEAVALATSSPKTELTTILGDVKGQIAIGNDKVIQIGNINGGILHVYPNKDVPQPQPCVRPVYIRPRRPVDFLGRAAQLSKIGELAKSRIPVEVYGKFGFGKTTLLQYLAFYPPDVNHKDGLVYFSSHDLVLDDILLKLYDCFFRRPTDFRPNETCIQRDLNEMQALILIDDVKLNREDTNTLLNTLPESVLILATEQQILWDRGESIYITGLPKKEALDLLIKEVGYEIPLEEKEAARKLVALTEGHPLSIKRAAAQVKKNRLSLAQITNMMQESANYDRFLLVQATNSLFEAEQRVLAFLAVGGGSPLPESHLIALTRLPISILVDVIRKLQNHDLVRILSSNYSLTADLAELLKQTWDLQPWALQCLSYYADWASEKMESSKALLENMEFIISVLRWGIRFKKWEDVLRLSRAVESTLALSAQWGKWEQVLNWILHAAKSVGDRESIALAQNQLGVLELSLGDERKASKNLIRALQSRQMLNDENGASVTQHNLRLSLEAFQDQESDDSVSDVSNTTQDSEKLTVLDNDADAQDDDKEEQIEKKEIVFKSTWRMDILTQSTDELLAAWKKVDETPGSVSVSSDEVIGLRPYNVTPDNFSTWVRYLENVGRVYYIDLSNVQIKDENLNHLAHFSHLEELSLAETEVTSSGLANLRSAAGLLRLDLSNCNWLDDDGLEYLQILQNLIWLNLKGTKITHAGLLHLNELTRISHLILRDTNISNTDLNALEGLHRLKYLDISETQIDDAGLVPLCRFTHLRSLWIEDCKKITDAGMAHLSCMTSLRRLRLNNTNITDEGLKHLENLERLEHLEVKRCWNITQEGIRKLQHSDLRILGNSPSH